jgi:hypothetical protein
MDSIGQLNVACKLLDEWIGLDSLGGGLDWVRYFENAFGLDWTGAFLNVDLFWIGFNGRGS